MTPPLRPISRRAPFATTTEEPKAQASLTAAGDKRCLANAVLAGDHDGGHFALGGAGEQASQGFELCVSPGKQRSFGQNAGWVSHRKAPIRGVDRRFRSVVLQLLTVVPKFAGSTLRISLGTHRIDLRTIRAHNCRKGAVTSSGFVDQI